MTDHLAEKLSTFLDALDAWGCEDNLERAKEILDFQRCGYDLSEYQEYSADNGPMRPKAEVN